MKGRGVLRSRRPWVAAGSVALALTLLVPTLSACGASGGNELVVPVLWASGTGDSASGGIERARVRVGEGDGGFTVDLADSEAEGAGPAWLAASASAAAVATLVSGVDPSTLEVSFSVTGRIDGPSGGAALAVGVLAAIRGLTLRDGVTMTGTISPDGFVGRIGAVATKVRAAADNGFNVVLVPVANATDRDVETGLDVVALGESLGVEVRPVVDLGAAVAAFTGGPITAGPDSPPPLRPAVEAVAASTSEAMVARLADALAVSSASSSVREIPAIRLASAQSALAAGNLADAYGIATDGWLRLQRNSASEATTAAALASGVETVRARLGSEAASVMAAADAALDRAGNGDTLSGVARLNLPAALGWLTYARAVAEAVASVVPTALGADQLGALAGTLAEQRAEVEVLWPDAEEAVLALNEGGVRLTDDPAAFLDGYTGLIVSAAKANETYLADVLDTGRVGQAVTQTAAVATTVLSTLAESGATPEIRASAALSWWFITAAEVAGRQAYGLEDLGIGTGIGAPANQQALDTAIRNASDTITAAAGNLDSQGVDTSYPVWSAAWGVAAAAGDTDTAAADGEILALGEVWYSAVTTFLLTAATAPRLI